MRNNFKPADSGCLPPLTDTLAKKDAALKAALAYIEAQGGFCEWWKDELAYRTHRCVRQALEISEGQQSQHDKPARRVD